MSSTEKKISRKEQILQCLALMLEATPGGRITTAGLAKEVGVSEAALYRHFPSKAKMFEGLIEFIEDTIFTRVTKIVSDEPSALAQCEKILHLLLGFTEKNPGITRLLTGDALTGETERLHQRITQFFSRLETQLKQIIRDAEFNENKRSTLSAAATANLLLALAEGRIAQFVRSNFQNPPTENWSQQWRLFESKIFTS